MTRAAWAERKVRALQQRHKSLCLIEIAEVGILAEHKRAVNVVKREIERVKKDQHTYHSEERCLILGSLETVLKALQKGRT